MKLTDYGLVMQYGNRNRGYPAKRALPAMRKHGGRALLAGYPRNLGQHWYRFWSVYWWQHAITSTNGMLYDDTKHYLNQCWLLISGVLWHSPESNFTVSTPSYYFIYSVMILKIIFLQLLHLAGANELRKVKYDMHKTWQWQLKGIDNTLNSNK